jgi:hypothetical protein
MCIFFVYVQRRENVSCAVYLITGPSGKSRRKWVIRDRVQFLTISPLERQNAGLEPEKRDRKMPIGHPRLHARGCNVSITISPAANGWRTRASGRSGQTPLSEFENHETRFIATERKPTPTIANQIFAFLEACVMDYEARTSGAWNKHGQRATGSILCILDRNNKCRKKGRATESLRLGCIPGNKFTGRQTCEKEREIQRDSRQIRHDLGTGVAVCLG